MELMPDVLDLLRSASICYLATTMPDGSPQVTQVWVDTDGEDVLINTVEGHQKLRNVRRDPRVALTVSDPARPTDYVQIRGEVREITTEGAREHIDDVSQKYLGKPYPHFGGGGQRVLLRIAPRRVSSPRG
ncbi:PPOX class F420-dependent oxidoreductase [Amnibacterium kyonggiense]|uniref:PPOX class probable F420-dependent enzyme n=1 Tax=Amnibacterium kyonggiense TaxID=595671 RepID=A0A4R7FT05_9MICO|nr:PPOX class F420-dependent oxidoreductase [Amnibacterium kyonggiense]TDS80936.1 PPOX class probable F420-dependent enzyme [Amnibacterium kyonggiense]